MKEQIVNPRKIVTYHYLYHQIPIDISYYYHNICHISFPNCRCGVYRNEFRSESETVIYFDSDPEYFWERYLLALFFERFDTKQTNEYNEIIIRGSRWFKYFYQVFKSLVVTGELTPVIE